MSLIRSGTVRGGCRLCGQQHAACGTPSDTVPAEARMEVAAVGGPLKKYEVTTPSGVKTTMKLSDADAERLGVLDAPAQERETEIPDRPAEPVETETPTKARGAKNKARTAANKDGAGGGDD